MSTHALGADTGRRMLDRLDALEARYRGLLQNAHGQPVTQGPPFCIWGRTTTIPDYPTYPTAGNIVVCELGVCDASPLTPGSTASNNFTAFSPPEYVLAKGYDSPLPFSGQVVPLRWMGGQWWFWHRNFRKGVAQASISAGSSGSVAIYDNGSSMGNRTCYYDWYNTGAAAIANGDKVWVAWCDDQAKWIVIPIVAAGTAGRNRCVMVGDSGYYGWRDGDGATSARPIIGWNGTNSKTVKLFPTMNGFTGNTEGTVYTVNSAPAAFSDNWIVLKQDARYCITFTHIWGLPALSSSDANTYLRAAAHDHSYTDNGSPMTTGTATPQAQSLTRKLVGVEARIDFSSGADAYATSTGEQMYYVPGTTPDDEARIWTTTIGYVRRNGADVNVNLLLTKIHGANESRPYHVDQFVKIEQTSDS